MHSTRRGSSQRWQSREWYHVRRSDLGWNIGSRMKPSMNVKVEACSLMPRSAPYCACRSCFSGVGVGTRLQAVDASSLLCLSVTCGVCLPWENNVLLSGDAPGDCWSERVQCDTLQMTNGARPESTFVLNNSWCFIELVVSPTGDVVVVGARTSFLPRVMRKRVTGHGTPKFWTSMSCSHRLINVHLGQTFCIVIL
jgi:hypothetical protein